MAEPPRKRYVYIAGPYTKGDVGVNIRAAIAHGDALATAGLIPYVPHLTHFWHLIFPHGIAFWYEYDLAWLDKCDCLLRLNGESAGADNEVAHAKGLGIPVYHSLPECLYEELKGDAQKFNQFTEMIGHSRKTTSCQSLK